MIKTSLDIIPVSKAKTLRTNYLSNSKNKSVFSVEREMKPNEVTEDQEEEGVLSGDKELKDKIEEIGEIVKIEGIEKIGKIEDQDETEKREVAMKEDQLDEEKEMNKENIVQEKKRDMEMTEMREEYTKKVTID